MTWNLRARLTKDNLWRLGASLVLALVLWGWVNTIEDPSAKRTFSDLQITVKDLAPELTITTPIPRVAVQLEAPRSVMIPITASLVTPFVDLSNITGPGDYDVPIKVNEIDEIWHSNVTPETLHITVERLVTTNFPLTWQEAENEGATLRVINDVVPTVSSVAVTGAESVVARINKVVLPITLDNQLRTFVGSFTPQALDTSNGVIANVTINPSPITATVQLTTRGKSVAVLPQVIGRPAEGYQSDTYVVNPATVVVDGPAEVLDTIMFVQTEPVDIQNADGTVQKRVSMTGLPAGVTVIEPSSGEVDVVVPITQIGVRQDLPGQRVQGVNLGQGLGSTILPTEITVTVIGPDAALSSLGAGDISAQVDLTGLGPGTYTLEPQVRVPQGVTWVASNPTSVTVTISNASATSNETSPEGAGSPSAAPPEASAEATAPGP